VIGELETNRIFAEADWQEAEALLSNPRLNDDILVSLYQRSDSFAALPDDRWCDLVSMSAKNPLLVSPNDTEYSPDLGHYRIQKAIFSFLSIVPTTSRGLHTAYQLLDAGDPQHVHWPEQIDRELSRWSGVQIAGFRDQPRKGHFTALTLVDEFRCLVAAMYGKSLGDKKSKVHGTPSASDVAVRCAYYGKANLDQKAMKAGHQKDEDVFTLAVLCNDHVFHIASLRKLVEDEYLRGDLISRYRKRCDQIHNQWPNFDPQPLTEWLREMKPDGPGESATPADQETLRRLKLLDRKINFMSEIMIWAVVSAAWVIVCYVVFQSLNRWLGSGWGSVSGIVAYVCAAIAAGLAGRYVHRQLRRVDPSGTAHDRP
jgi:hypothetical protein